MQTIGHALLLKAVTNESFEAMLWKQTTNMPTEFLYVNYNKYGEDKKQI
jgi:hypothetical protein